MIAPGDVVPDTLLSHMSSSSSSSSSKYDSGGDEDGDDNLDEDLNPSPPSREATFELSIRTPCTPSRWRAFDAEMTHAWNEVTRLALAAAAAFG